MDTYCHIELFGELRVRVGGETHTRFRTRKGGWLLAYLALNLSQSHSRERLLELFWPEMAPDPARLNLNTTLSQLRRQLEPVGVPTGSILVADRQSVRLNAEVIRTDVTEFERLIREARQRGARSKEEFTAEEWKQETQERAALWQEAISLYRDGLLPDCSDDWVAPEQTRFQSDYLDCLTRLTALWEEMGRYTEALAIAQKTAAADPYDEAGYQTQMRLLVRLRRPAAAIEAYEAMERMFQHDLGARPSAATRRMAETIRQDPRAAALMRAEIEAHSQSSAPPPAAPEPTPEAKVATPPPAASVLPLQLTRFFGREQEQAQLIELLRTRTTRLVTLLGPGGAGKTRLSIEIAGAVAPDYAGRVWFVSLADVPDASLIASAIANTLRLPPGEDDPLDRAVAILSDAPSLLVLDNLEHLLRDTPAAGKGDNANLSSAAGLVRLLLQRAPNLACLATSRQTLRIGGEHAFPLPPLALPSSEEDASPEPLMQNESVALYVDRARAARPDFALTAQNAPAVAALCRKLEGMPLALEMAAAWVKTIPPYKMLERLERQLDLLVSRRRDLPPRHQSLRATIEWSYDLLEPSLRRTFARLSVFRGGWTLEAAEAVCGEETLFALEALVEQSLIVVTESEDEPRYRMLEPLREFAAEKLAEIGEQEETSLRHARWFQQRAEQAHQGNLTEREKEHLDGLQRDLDNIRTALNFCFDQLSPERNAIGASLTNVFIWFSMVRGYISEGWKWAERALALASPEVLQNTHLHYNAAVSAHELKQMPIALSLTQEAMRQAEREGNIEYILQVQNLLAVVYYDIGDIPQARAHWEAGAKQAKESHVTHVALSFLANLSELEYDLEDYAAARNYMEECLALHKQLNSPRRRGRHLSLMGKIALMQGDLEQAWNCFSEGLRLREEAGDILGVVETLEGMAKAALTGNHPDHAVRLLASATMTRNKTGVQRKANEEAEFQKNVSQAKSILSEAQYSTAWGEGSVLSLDQAVAYALTERKLRQ